MDATDLLRNLLKTQDSLTIEDVSVSDQEIKDWYNACDQAKLFLGIQPSDKTEEILKEIRKIKESWTKCGYIGKTIELEIRKQLIGIATFAVAAIEVLDKKD